MKNEYQITKEHMMSRAKDFHLYRGKDAFAVILWSLLALIEIACVSLLLLCDGDATIIFLGIVIILLCIYKLFFERFVIVSRREAKILIFNKYFFLNNEYSGHYWIDFAL